MATVFVSGSMNIKRLDPKVVERIDNILASGLQIVVGDANGADKSIQSYLQSRGATSVVVYCSGTHVRNNVGKWPVKSVDSHHEPGSRAFFTAKDVEMAKNADYGLMVWDLKSTGTLSNMMELLRQGKKSVVFIHRTKQFQNIASVSDVEQLIAAMTEQAKQAAEAKIHITSKLAALKHEQSEMF